MAIRSLLKGETIKLDNHHAGQPIALNDEGLHLHKRFNERNRKRGIVDVIIKLNGHIEVTSMDGNDAPTIIREIRDVFHDERVRTVFINSVKDALEQLATTGITGATPNEEVKRIINRILIGVTEYFGASINDISDILYRNDRDQIISIMYQEGNRGENNLYAKVNLHRQSIALTKDKKMLNRI